MVRRLLPAALAALAVLALAPAVVRAPTSIPRLTKLTAAPAKPPAVHHRQATPGFLIANVQPGHVVAVRSKPDGPVILRVGAHTIFGSPSVLGVTARRGDWVQVGDERLGNGKRGWARVSRALTLTYTTLALTVDVSARRLELREGGRLVLRTTVAVGGAGTPTPTGRFAVTDKLDGTRFASSYGCCILALSAVQPNLRTGWSGGNRIAIHGTDRPASIGQATSNGCIRAGESPMRKLLKLLPLGTPVRIRE